eukprot:CAMPEP_0170307354 /NCGR_PEP_ID=MMETSP0116_2-20130129/54091_1 /TAXON_ID=400756 /ORGANISM="Durinskia baltica, Strain CSIRO CS-38" /LENGTH=130 /DNA_ID=CAMNT_0010559485 /DNA_START=27 /DNA_END=416 /DNA_ORIENTATION=+
MALAEVPPSREEEFESAHEQPEVPRARGHDPPGPAGTRLAAAKIVQCVFRVVSIGAGAFQADCAPPMPSHASLRARLRRETLALPPPVAPRALLAAWRVQEKHHLPQPRPRAEERVHDRPAMCRVGPTKT